MMFNVLVLFLSTFSFLFFKVTNSKSLDDIMETLSDEKKGGKVCAYKNNATIQITDKLEARTVKEVLSIGKPLSFQNLNIQFSKCCISEYNESLAFIKIENTKIKKNVFSGWMFSKRISLNNFEDPKFDVVLIRCF